MNSTIRQPLLFVNATKIGGLKATETAGASRTLQSALLCNQIVKPRVISAT
jgi:hypothetical protein